jgi:hypothetical protein
VRRRLLVLRKLVPILKGRESEKLRITEGWLEVKTGWEGGKERRFVLHCISGKK